MGVMKAGLQRAVSPVQSAMSQNKLLLLQPERPILNFVSLRFRVPHKPVEFLSMHLYSGQMLSSALASRTDRTINDIVIVPIFLIILLILYALSSSVTLHGSILKSFIIINMGFVSVIKNLLTEHFGLVLAAQAGLLFLVALIFLFCRDRKASNAGIDQPSRAERMKRKKETASKRGNRKYKVSIRGNRILFTSNPVAVNPLAITLLKPLSTKCELFIITHVNLHTYYWNR